MVRSLHHRGNRGSYRGYNFEVSCLSCKKSFDKTIYSEENKFRFLFYISSEKDIRPAGDYMYGLSSHIHTELKRFMNRLSMSYVLYNKSGIDNT